MALWTPAEITTTLWLDASDADTITIDVGVSQWADKSGNNNHATQATSDSQPVVTSAGINGLDVLNLDGSNDSMATGNLPLDSTTTAFFVLKPAILSGDRSPLNIGAGDELVPFQLYIASDGSLKDWRAGAQITGLAAGTPSLGVHAVASNFDVSMWKDGTAGTLGGNCTSFAGSRPIYIGKNQSFGALGYFQGDVAEIVLVANDVSDADRQKFEGYLAHKWGLAANLPADHPYKNDAPFVDTTIKEFTYTIPAGTVSEDLTDFPVVIALGSSVGSNNFDASAVFDELGADWSKLTITDASDNKLYMEIEEWDAVAETAVLHVKVLSILTASNTVLTVSYDPTNPDNSAYIGVIGSTPGQAVWNTGFAAVYHAKQDPTAGGDCILDSTVNVNHGTPNNVTQDVDGNYVFNGTSAFIEVPDSNSLDLPSTYAIEIGFEVAVSQRGGLISKLQSSGSYYGYVVLWDTDTLATPTDNTVKWFIGDGSGVWEDAGNTIPISTSNNIVLTRTEFYRDGALFKTRSNTDFPTANAEPLWIGKEHTGEFFNGTVSYVRLHKVTPTAGWIEATNKSLTDQLFTVAAAGLKTVQYLDQLYDLEALIVQVTLDQSYALRVYLTNTLIQVYGFQLISSLIQTYGQQEVLVAFLTQYYRSNSAIRNKLNQIFKSADSVKAIVTSDYTLTYDLIKLLEQEYILSAGEVRNYSQENYDIKAVFEILKSFKQSYNLFSASKFLTNSTSAIIAGQQIDTIQASVEYSNSSYVGNCSLQLAHYPEWDIVDYLQSVIVTIDGQSYNFVVVSKGKSETVNNMVLNVEAMSQAILLDFPYATEIEDNSPISGTMSQIVNNLAALEGLSITWSIPVDDVLTINEVQSEGKSPLSVIKEIVNELGGILQSLPDGSIHAVPKYVVDTNKYSNPEETYTTGDDYISLQEETEKRDGYNKYFITDSSTDSGYTLESEEVSSYHKTIKAYKVPWTTDSVRLITSELTNVVIVPVANPVLETLEEQIEIVNGVGNVSKPCYNVVSYDYKTSTNLGVVTIKEDGTVKTATAANTLVTITYKTKYWKWNTYNTDQEDVQFILETI